MKNNIKWIALFSVIIILCAALLIIRRNTPSDAVMARIVQDGNVIREIDLLTVDDPYEFSVSCDEGSNTIRVEKSRICVIDADCPDKICVNTGYISDSELPIVCLPHKLSIVVSGTDSGYDAVVGGQ